MTGEARATTMDQRTPVITAGTRLHSLADGHYLATVARDYHLGETFSVDHFKDWAHEAPKKGDPMSDDFMAALFAIGRAYRVTTGIPIVRMDTGERV